MPGVKRFDQEKALEGAMVAFWRHGFDGTSIQILEKETGVARSSLYATFGDKEAIFLKALARYETLCFRPILQALDQHQNALDALAALLEAHRQNLSNPARPGGCLLTRVAVEKGNAGDAAGRSIRQAWSELESAVYAALRWGQQRGEIDAREDPRSLARFFVATVHGMAVMSRLQDDVSSLRDIAAGALKAIGAKPAEAEESS